MTQGFKDFTNPNVPGGQGDTVSRITQGVGSLHPTGSWLFYESFDTATPLVAWQTTLGGGTIATDSTKSYRGPNSLKITTAAALFSTPVLLKLFPIGVSKFGIETMFQSTPSGAAANFSIFLQCNIYPGKGLMQKRGVLSVNIIPAPLKKTLSLANGFLLADPLTTNLDAATWHNMKLVVDPLTLKYDYASYDGVEYGAVSGQSLTDNGVQAFDGNVVSASIAVSTQIATAEAANIDDVIVTINE